MTFLRKIAVLPGQTEKTEIAKAEKIHDVKHDVSRCCTMNAIKFFYSDSILYVTLSKLLKPDNQSSVELQKLIEASRK